MNRENHFLKSVIHTVKLDEEPIPGKPLVEICGQERVLIENHRGIVGYGSCEIQVKVRFGCIYICGENLKLTQMSKGKLVVTGKIGGVNLRGKY